MSSVRCGKRRPRSRLVIEREPLVCILASRAESVLHLEIVKRHRPVFDPDIIERQDLAEPGPARLVAPLNDGFGDPIGGSGFTVLTCRYDRAYVLVREGH